MKLFGIIELGKRVTEVISDKENLDAARSPGNQDYFYTEVEKSLLTDEWKNDAATASRDEARRKQQMAKEAKIAERRARVAAKKLEAAKREEAKKLEAAQFRARIVSHSDMVGDIPVINLGPTEAQMQRVKRFARENHLVVMRGDEVLFNFSGKDIFDVVATDVVAPPGKQISPSATSTSEMTGGAIPGHEPNPLPGFVSDGSPSSRGAILGRIKANMKKK